MEDLQAAMDELLYANPEMTFFEASTELVKKGEINYEATEDPNVHTYLSQIYRRSKILANRGRVNKDM